MALKPFRKGDILLSIPSSLTIDCTPRTDQPEEAGLTLVHHLASRSLLKGTQAYIQHLPRPTSPHFTSTTDFYSPQDLSLLHFPPVMEETQRRVQRTVMLAEKAGTSVEELMWATWLVVSRVIAITASPDKGGDRKLLIPFLDMINHGEAGKGILGGKNVEGGWDLRVTAGEDVEVGEEVRFAYGGGALGADRFIQDYGFLPTADRSFQRVNRHLLKLQRPEIMYHLMQTSLEEDRRSLAEGVGENGEELSVHGRLAMQFRIALKEASEVGR